MYYEEGQEVTLKTQIIYADGEESKEYYVDDGPLHDYEKLETIVLTLQEAEQLNKYGQLL